MFLGIYPLVTSQCRCIKKNDPPMSKLNCVSTNSKVSFGKINIPFTVDSIEISPKSKKLLKEAYGLLVSKRLSLDPVEVYYATLHPEKAVNTLHAEDIYTRPVKFTVIDKGAELYQINHYPVCIIVENDRARILSVKEGESVGHDPNWYLECGLEAICAKNFEKPFSQCASIGK